MAITEEIARQQMQNSCTANMRKAVDDMTVTAKQEDTITLDEFRQWLQGYEYSIAPCGPTSEQWELVKTQIARVGSKTVYRGDNKIYEIPAGAIFKY